MVRGPSTRPGASTIEAEAGKALRLRRSFRRLSFDGKDGASGGEQRWSEIVFSLLRSLGVNYLWGIANFTVGVTLGGIWVAVALIGKMVQ